jgi:hypothetical protein
MPMGFFRDGGLTQGLGTVMLIVMLIVIRKMAYVRDFLPGMTVMTLMTVIYGPILDRGCISTS